MYALVFILSTPAFLGTYDNLNSCQKAIHEIRSGRLNPPRQVLPELDKSIKSEMKNKDYICIPVSTD